MQNAHAARAYSQNTRTAGTPRSVEYQAFQRVTALLKNADREETPPVERVAAIMKNNQLWSVLAADLLSEGNTLQSDLRANLLSLAEFSRKTGLKAMSGRAEIAALVEVNLMIMRGLRGDAGDVQPAAAGPAHALAADAASSSNAVA